MMQIHLKNIRCNPVIGAYEDERHRRQPLWINIWMTFDEGGSPESDKLADTLDYCEFAKQLVAEVNQTEFYLVERMVVFVLDKAMEFPQVSEARVEVDKPEAIKEFADSVSLTGQRKR